MSYRIKNLIILVILSIIITGCNTIKSSPIKPISEQLPNLSYSEPVKLMTSEIDLREINSVGDNDRRIGMYAIYNPFKQDISLYVNTYCENYKIAKMSPTEPKIIILNGTKKIEFIEIISLQKGSTKCKIIFNDSFYQDLELQINVREVDKRYEQIKCIFNNQQQNNGNCVSGKYHCLGIGSCFVNVTGIEGTKIKWEGICDGERYSTIDGTDEIIEFECSNTKCIDSDGGKDYYVKGKIMTIIHGKIEENNAEDHCDDKTFANSNLIEYYCPSIEDQGMISSQPYFCPNGCQDGACMI